MADANPSVIVLAGPNGAGKTTSSRTLLADTLKLYTFVNADTIAQGLAAFDPESVAFEAGRIMLQQLDALAEQRVSFAFETTLATRSLAQRIQRLRENGYTVNLVYFWVESADFAVARVALRVLEGGHNIPEATIRRRYTRSVDNFFRLYRGIVSSWKVYNTTRTGIPNLIAQSGNSGEPTIFDEAVWRQMQQEIVT